VLILLTIINVILIAYLFLISLRIVLGWFAPQALGRAWHLLVSATDPYLNVFRRIRFLRIGFFDFSPIAAVVVLVVAYHLVSNLMNSYWHLTLAFFLTTVVSAVWSGAAVVLIIFLIVGIIRLTPFLFRVSGGAVIWKAADTIIRPVVEWISRTLRLGARASYQQQLLISIAVIFIVWGLGQFVVIRFLRELLMLIPI
jgi:YggT family protein